MTTPLRRQYLDIKRRYPHAILFFRMGDFYETFDGDAETVSRELEITLTSRPVSKGERVPLAGIPHHALDSYLAKLIARGYKVAICEQTTEPMKGKAIVDRAVVRVVTPGTLVEDNLLDAGRNNYLAAIFPDNGHTGLAHVDVSTGEFACLQGETPAIAAELERLRPAELILPPGAQPSPGLAAILTPLAAADIAVATDTVLRHFEAPTLDALGLSGVTLGAAAAGLVLDYLRENQKAVLGHITRLQSVRPGACMLIDANTRRNLELFEPLRKDDAQRSAPGTLLGVLDQTKTPMGQRLLRRWLGQPLLDANAITARQDAVQLFHDSGVRRGRAQQTLAHIGDIERALARISAAAQASLTPSTPRDLLALRRGLEAIPELRDVVLEGATTAHPEALEGPSSGRTASTSPSVRPEETRSEAESRAVGQSEHQLPETTPQPKSPALALTRSLHSNAEPAALIAAAIADDITQGSVIRPSFSSELDILRSTARDARQYLAELERRERERTGIKTLKVGYNRVFGYYIEITHAAANAGDVPDDYQRKQTLVNGERYTTPELREHEYRVLHAQELQSELETTLLRQVCTQVAAHSARILEAAAAVAQIDTVCSLAEVASRYGYVRPTVDDSDELIVREGRHPVVERMLPEGTFVPNDLCLSSSDAQVILLTGPNMAGKSTYLRQTALIVIMAQTGSFVPAREARVGLVDRIFSRVGALDDIAAGHSTFMVEMLETAAMLDGSTSRSLLIFDEIGRGTSTYDGMSIARAVAEYIHNRPDARARTLFATHYHELTELAGILPRVRNFNVAVAEENGGVVFLHRILPGGADRSYGVHVAQLAGLPGPVVLRAREILAQLESSPRGSSVTQTEATPQLPLFGGQDDSLRREVAALDPDGMTPLQALTTLYNLAAKARSNGVPHA